MTVLSGAHPQRRLLLVEDDAQQRSSLAELLESDGYDVAAVSNGVEAFEALRNRPRPDVILLDLMMPVKDGWEFRIEQKLDPSLSNIPVVAMSADHTSKAAAIDADLYLQKPFQYATLVGAIHQVISLRNSAHVDRLAALATLASGVTHEIDNPLTYVIANLQQLEEELPRLFRECARAGGGPARDLEPLSLSSSAINRIGEVGSRLREALEAAERIRSIVLHVKTFSRAGDEHRTLLDVRSVLDSSVSVVLSEVRHRARLIKDYQHAPLVMANPGQLAQVFLNLLLNAAQAIPQGAPERHVIRVATRSAGPERALVEVSDTGAGIPPEIRDRIFDPFFTTKPLGVGAGLGLSICHGIVTSLGGEISVESEPGKGSTFRVLLPAATAGNMKRGANAGAAASPAPALGAPADRPSH